ncbi:MAG: phosphoribosylglycinamide formyltransferase [Rhodospirillaceae bacterium]|nr:phosphoribosylglycinamide formyltransferase [Rhodospirillaceae bacterium]
MGAARSPRGARLKVGVLISGRGSNMQALIDACRAPDFAAEIALVVSNDAAAAGLARAEQAGIATAALDHRPFKGDRPAFERALTALLEKAGIEFVCLAGFMRLLTDTFVEHWRDRLINIHPSLLPAFRGLDTHRRALEAGVRLHGCTVHFVRTAMDDGPIIVQAAVPVVTGDSEAALAARVLAAEHRCYPLALGLCAEGRVRVENERCVVDAAFDSAATLLSPPAGSE